MPIYQYTCDTCGDTMETLQSISVMEEEKENPRTCEACEVGLLLKEFTTTKLNTEPYDGAGRRIT